jgi:glycosyltransferase involved in cell wall biosynthesis
MRVALIHYWLVKMRGGEKVLESLCRMYPQADIYVNVLDTEKISELIASHRIETTFINSLPFASKFYKNYLPLMPIALEHLDLRGYDLIISSESGPAKGVIVPPEAMHICYCHSPMRYIWNMYHDYRQRVGLFKQMFMPPLAHYIRMWDSITATRVHHFVANSFGVSRRIEAYYGRKSDVIYPPVDVSSFQPAPASEVGDHYLMVGELVPYKRPDLAIEAFNLTGKKLIVIGEGEMERRLRMVSSPNITFLGRQPFDVLRQHYARCKAVIFPGEEDFGIVPVEALASGRPVVAFGKGGATETIEEGRSGVFFREQTVKSLIDAIERLDNIDIDPVDLVQRASQFNIDRFERNFGHYVSKKMEERKVSVPPYRADWS